MSEDKKLKHPAARIPTQARRRQVDLETAMRIRAVDAETLASAHAAVFDHDNPERLALYGTNRRAYWDAIAELAANAT